jgi:hypothetical protein
VIRELGSALLAGALLVRPGAAHADPPQAPLVFVVDPKIGTEAGIRSADSLGRVLFRYDEVLPSLVAWDDRSTPGRVGAVVGRTLQWLFIDDPLAQFETTTVHEVFGHGARARQLGQEARFQLALPGIYCSILAASDNCTSSSQVSSATGNRDRDLLVTIGGVEANLLTAYWIDVRIVRSRGWAHQGDLLTYAASKFTYATSFLSRRLDTAGALETPGDDVDRSVTLLQDRFNLPRVTDRHRISSRLRTAYLWNLVDPMLWFAAYGAIYRGIGRGERWSRAPLPSLGETTIYAAPRFNLSPFGAEHYVDVFLERGAALIALYGRVGSSGLASYTGAGVRTLGLRIQERLTMDGELDVWSQPETLLDDRAVYERPQLRGLSAALSGDLRLIGALGLTAKLAYKARGYLAGQPIEEGPYGYVGASIALDRTR